ncbi:MAG: flippase [Planctomycetota bacterium]|jgi:O-antigen/teichoic acid export membrane protein
MYSKILKNTGFLVFVRLAQPVFSLLLFIAIARLRGPDLLGGFVIVLSYLAVFQTFSAFGFRYLLIREVANDHAAAGKYLLHSSLFSLPISIICAFAMYGLTAILGYDSHIQVAISIAGVALIATTLIENCEGIFVGLENIGPYAVVCFFENLLRVILSVTAIIKGFGLSGLIAIFTVTRFLAFGANLLLLKKILPAKPLSIDLSYGLQFFKSARIFALIIISAAIYSRADVLILSKIRGTADVGIYSAAFRFVAAAQLLLASFSNSLYPHISRLYQQSKNQFKVVSTAVIRFLVALVVPVIILFVLSAHQIIIVVFGPEFEDAAGVLQIVVLSILPFAFITVGDYILLSSHNQKLDLKINLCTVVCNLVLNFILIARWGITGAAVAMLSSMILYLVIQYYFLSRFVFRISLSYIFSRPVVAGTIMVIFFIVFKSIHIVPAVIISFVTYYLSLLIMNRLLPKNAYNLKAGKFKKT